MKKIGIGLAICCLLTACAENVPTPSGPTPIPVPVADAQATAVAANANVKATTDAVMARQVQQSASATQVAQATSTSLQLTQQAQSVALVQSTIDAGNLISTQTAQSIIYTSTLQALSVISLTNEITTTAQIRTAQADKLSSTNWALIIGGVIMALMVTGSICAVIVVAGVSASKKYLSKTSTVESGGRTYTLFFPAIGKPVDLSRFLLPPPAPSEGVTVDQNVIPNTEHDPVLENTERDRNTLKMSSAAGKTEMPDFTKDEHDALRDARQDAIRLLNLALTYYRKTREIDTGFIPRYDDLRKYSDDQRCSPEWRGKACRMIEKGGLLKIKPPGGKKEDQGTTVLDPYGTVGALLVEIEKRHVVVCPLDASEDMINWIKTVNSASRYRYAQEKQAIASLSQRVRPQEETS